ncbi:hypothetical protein MASR2M15_16560 [Anaerolineales bacterium]
MKLIVMALGMVLLMIGLKGQTQEAHWAEAAQAYTEGHYLLARDIYESEIAAEIYNVDIFFNLGLIYETIHDDGRAVLNYLRAYELAPRDAEVREKLNLYQIKTEFYLQDALFILANLSLPFLSLQELSLMLVLVTIGFSLALAHALYRKDWGWRRVVISTVSILFLASVMLFWARWYSNTRYPSVVVVEESALMSGPATDYLRYRSLSSGTVGRVISEAEGWYLIILPDQELGWVPERQARKVLALE